ncbi:hypothetical protein NPIL_612961, partial [Nephila pilipes]
MWDVKLFIFICVVFLTQFAHIRTDLNLRENYVDEETEDFPVDGNIHNSAGDIADDHSFQADPCTSKSCQNGGTCKVDKKTFKCECPFPYTGNKCEKKCKCDKGKCELKDGNTVCVCPPEFGLFTSSLCQACNCGKGVNCTFESTGWFSSKKTCICPKGYREVNEKCVGPCTENPCKNGGTCKDVKNGFECVCPSPYSGKICDTKADPCSLKPCKNGGTCTAKGSNFTCSCKSPYTGSKCEKVDPCASNPCQNGGTCKVVGSNFTCSCKSPFNGTKCENGPCSSNPCQNKGTCKVDGPSYTCDCVKPFGGKNCEEGPCISNPCLNNGTCKVVGQSFKCDCKLPFKGEKCEMDPCHPNQCKNGGICSIRGNSFSCQCRGKYFGNQCERECGCENGKCRLTPSGEEVCDCLPEFGKYSDNFCK